MFWIVFIFKIPRAGIMLSGQIINIPTVAQKESIIDSYSREVWNGHMKELTDVWKKREAEMTGMDKEEREAYREQNSWAWMEEDDKRRKEVEKEIAEYSRKANEDLRNRRIEQEKLAYILSRFSPASAYQLAAMNLAGTNINIKTIYEDDLQTYKNIFSDFIQKKQKESGGKGMFRISIDSKSGVSISDGRKESTLDLKELPRFNYPKISFASALNSTLIDVGLLSLFTIFSFLGGFIVFLKSDLR
jgi:hypothetical protein